MFNFFARRKALKQRAIWIYDHIDPITKAKIDRLATQWSLSSISDPSILREKSIGFVYHRLLRKKPIFKA